MAYRFTMACAVLLAAFGIGSVTGSAAAEAQHACRTVMSSAAGATERQAGDRARTQLNSRLARKRTAQRGRSVRAGRIATRCRPGPSGGPARCTSRVTVCP